MTSEHSDSSQSSIDPSSVVVAVDGSDDADRALAWAAEQAFLERRPLTVLTAVGAPVPPSSAWAGAGTAYLYQPHEMMESARAIAAAARAVAEHRHPQLQVATAVRNGDPRQVLVDISHGAHLIVMGSRGRGVFASRLLGSVSAAVIRAAACPVVVCRPEEREVGEPYRGVLVGADGTTESLPVIEAAFEQASLHRLPLTVVHAFWDELASMVSPSAVSRETEGLDEPRLLLAESVSGMAAKFPDVHVEQVLARGEARQCLSADSSTWHLVVVGRHPVDSLARRLSAPVATAVVERSRTTVLVVPQAEPTSES